jgi:hypothetical protein
MLLSDASDKGSGHLDATGGESEVKSDVKILHCYNMEVPCALSSGNNRKKETRTFFGFILTCPRTM